MELFQTTRKVLMVYTNFWKMTNSLDYCQCWCWYATLCEHHDNVDSVDSEEWLANLQTEEPELLSSITAQTWVYNEVLLTTLETCFGETFNKKRAQMC